MKHSLNNPPVKKSGATEVAPKRLLTARRENTVCGQPRGTRARPRTSHYVEVVKKS